MDFMTNVKKTEKELFGRNFISPRESSVMTMTWVVVLPDLYCIASTIVSLFVVKNNEFLLLSLDTRVLAKLVCNTEMFIYMAVCLF